MTAFEWLQFGLNLALTHPWPTGIGALVVIGWTRLPKRTRRGIRRRLKRMAKWSWKHATKTRQQASPRRAQTPDRPDNWTWPVEPGGPTVLYRHFDAAGRLLYVGITGAHRGGKRWLEHAEDKPWFNQVASSAVSDPYPSRADALYAEALAIRDEKPLHNICRPDPARIGRP